MTTKTTSDNSKFDNLLGPIDKKTEHLAREAITTARVNLLLKHSFFGNLSSRLRLVESSEWLTTAATDGRTLYFNSRFIMMLKPREVQFLLGHEILHVCYDHLDRNGTRNHQLYNIACDYAVNADLKKHKVGDFITSVPCLYEPKYDGWSSEKIYDDLMKDAKQNLQSLLDQMIDQHLEGEGKDGQDGKGPEKLSKGERDQLRQEMREAILQAAKQAKPGSLPKSVERLVGDISNPTMPWRELIQTTLTSSIRNDYSWTRMNRKGWHMEAVMPGMTPGEEIDVAIALDMSGSISNSLAQQFLGEVAGMMDTFDGYKVKVFCFDTQTYNDQDYSSENLEDIRDYKVMGGGGTDFEVCWTYMKDNDITPKQFIMFTDGYPFGSWGDPNYCDTLFVVHGNDQIEAPFGVTAHYEFEKARA
jgi:predicted metal-dependent peptidase